MFIRNRYNARKVQLLAGSYMVISDYPSVLKLESKAALAKPSVIEKNVMIFGSARVLSGDYAGAAAFFKKHLEKDKLKPKEKEWLRWFYGFSHLLGSAFRQAEPEFMSLAVSSRDALIAALSAYFLDSSLAKRSIKPEECKAVADSGRSRVVEALKTVEGWKKEVEKMENEIHISIIRKYIDEAGKWLFADNIERPIEPIATNEISELETGLNETADKDDKDGDTEIL